MGQPVDFEQLRPNAERDYTDSLAFANGLEAIESNRHPLAINNFTILIERHPKHPQYRFLRAKAYFNLGCFDSCVKDLEEALKLGLLHLEVMDLIVVASAEAVRHEGKAETYRPNILDLVSLRRSYKLQSLLLSADEYLAEAQYGEVISELSLAEKLMERHELAGEMGFKVGLLRAIAYIGLGLVKEALEIIDFHLKHAYAVGRDDLVRKFKLLRSNACTS